MFWSIWSAFEHGFGMLQTSIHAFWCKQDAKTAHLGFSPYSIFIDPQARGKQTSLAFWKLCRILSVFSASLKKRVAGKVVAWRFGLLFQWSLSLFLLDFTQMISCLLLAIDSAKLPNCQAQVQWGQMMDCPFAFSGQEVKLANPNSKHWQSAERSFSWRHVWRHLAISVTNHLPGELQIQLCTFGLFQLVVISRYAAPEMCGFPAKCGCEALCHFCVEECADRIWEFLIMSTGRWQAANYGSLGWNQICSRWVCWRALHRKFISFFHLPHSRRVDQEVPELMIWTFLYCLPLLRRCFLL